MKNKLKNIFYALIKHYHYSFVLLIIFLLGSYIFINFSDFSSNKDLSGNEEYISNFAKLNAKFYETGTHDTGGRAGPFELIGDNEFLFITQCGEVFTSKIINERKRLESKRIGHIKNAICADNFIKGIVKDSQLFSDFLLVSYVENIGSLSYRLALDKILKHGDEFDFKNATRLFESTPGVSFKRGVHIHTFGRIAKKNENEIFLVIADYGAPQYIDDDDATLGKLFLINIQTGTSTLIAKGFRSPGGLFYDQKNDLLWESEHGPTGGDEVNLIKEGYNYGWPHVTYGRHEGHIEHAFGLHHKGYAKPEYVFVPSVGTSNIMQYPAEGEITHWRGDLILATMRARTLFRLKVEDQTIIYAEPIGNIGSRIRDLQIDDTGKIYLKTDDDKLIIIQAEPNWQPSS